MNQTYIKRYFIAAGLKFYPKKSSLNKKQNNELKYLNLKRTNLKFKQLNKKDIKILNKYTSLIIRFKYKDKYYVKMNKTLVDDFDSNKKSKKYGIRKLLSFFGPFVHFERKFSSKLISNNLFINYVKKNDEIFEDIKTDKDQHLFWLFLFIFTDILLLWFYFFLRKKLSPLILFKNKIKDLSEGKLIVDEHLKGKDEISEISNEFNKTLLKIKELRESRNLFLRNIMHELKTPITKGKIISDILEDTRKKEILQRVFYRLEYLLIEFSKVEELTSGKITLKKREYRVLDILNEAVDLLLLDNDKLNITCSDVKINVDFQIFSIALKNLIDNALKYNTNGNPKIVVNNNCINIINKGKELHKDMNEYYKPFNREYESIDKGLGLGLYITKNIVDIHDFALIHTFKDNFHNFSIIFKK